MRFFSQKSGFFFQALKLETFFSGPIYRLPGFYAFDNANPRRVYQKWCAAFDGLLSKSDIDLIVSAAIKNDDNFYEYGIKAWENMQEQKRWNLTGELITIWRFWKKKIKRKD